MLPYVLVSVVDSPRRPAYHGDKSTHAPPQSTRLAEEVAE